ncbi:hypothetical protein CHS0354_004465 [Potamilus streckersoni]|uniref:L-seryl-tRNA(Sec) kinase n=1 Tax=Potamilus streckersoni TaxID=2493646 RepID=A0AAE0SNG7_9BIVA|nr:hypothetical protein CHS0354_004465 [Potamilus streckersoni]
MGKTMSILAVQARQVPAWVYSVIPIDIVTAHLVGFSSLMAGRPVPCVLLLCGLPGSGKTTHTKELVKKLIDENVLALVFDELMPQELAEKMIPQSSVNENLVASPWKQFREDMLCCVDTFISHLVSDITTSSKRDILYTIRKPVHINEELWLCFMKAIVSSLVADWTKPTLIVIDDNMYYRSMRYQYYQIARKYNSAFCQIYLSCDMDVACVRNKQREVKVPDSVIITMATKIEPPDPLNNRWEKFSITVKAEQHIDICQIQDLVHKARLEPVQSLPQVDVEQQNHSRRLCSESVVHQSDQVLRKLVAKHMAQLKVKGCSKADLKVCAEKFKSQRSKILDHLRTGIILVPDYVANGVSDASKDQHSLFVQFFETLLTLENLDQLRNCNEFEQYS